MRPKKILIIFTGGTIGSSLQEGVLTTNQTQNRLLLELYKKQANPELVDFDIKIPFEILSENLQTKHLEKLIGFIQTINTQAYSGIIITHGTDTLAFSAQAVALFFQTLNIPLFFVSSLAPLNTPQSNGLENFSAAVYAIVQDIAPDIYVAYKNPAEPSVSIFYAATLLQSPQLSNHFFASKPPCAFYNSEKLSYHATLKSPKKEQTLKPSFASNILVIEPHSALNYAHFNLNNIDFIIHKLYHSGTAPAHLLEPFLETCHKNSIPLFFLPALKRTHDYESAARLKALGGHFIYNMSYESALIKLMLGFKNFQSIEALLNFMHTPRSHELLEQTF